MRITARQLRAREACKRQVAIFKKEWPRGVRVTFDSLQRAAELELDLDWFADTFIPISAQAAYWKATAAAWPDFRKARDSAWAAYRNTRGSLLADFYKAVRSARAAYFKAIAPVLYQTITKYGL